MGVYIGLRGGVKELNLTDYTGETLSLTINTHYDNLN